MQLTTKQQEGLEIAVERYRRGEKYTVISGYAGTGKSTLVRFIVDALHIPENQVVYTAYTGKACTVLQHKNNKNVLTLHKLLYKFQLMPDGHFIKIPRQTLEYQFIIVDECSMVSSDMVDELLSHKGIYVIFLGDPFQIPPVSGGDNGLLKAPHVFLEEIMRQALDNEIIKFSMDVRLGNPLPKEYKGNNVQIYGSNDLTGGMLLWADQVICATNATRLELNNSIRELKGLSGEPQVGDKVICLQNNWDIYDDDSNALVNGTIGYITDIEPGAHPVNPYFHIRSNKIPFYEIDIETDEKTHFNCLEADKNMFFSDEPYLSTFDSSRIKRNKICQERGIVPPDLFTFGYVITCHKAQGSSWANVLLIEEGHPFNEYEHRRWLYTAITRAEQKLVIIRK